MSTTKYNGYTNRATWAVVLHIQNDEGLLSMFLNQDENYIKDQWNEWAADLIDNPTNLTRDMRMMLVDIRDLDSVDWTEVEEAMKDED